MSMFSIASSREGFFATVSWKRYRLHTTMSIGFIPSEIISFSWPLSSLMYNIPPWIFGCRVLTLPPIISLNPVTFSIGVASIPFSKRNFKVPPVDTISKPKFDKVFANVSRPFLFVTLISALFSITLARSEC